MKLVHDDGKVTGAIFDTDDGYVQINAKSTLLAPALIRRIPR